MRKHLFMCLGLMAACFSVPSAFTAGSSFSPAGSWWSIGTGVAGIAVVGAAATLLPRALKSFRSGMWFGGGLLLLAWSIAFVTTLAVSIGNVSNSRSDAVEVKADAIGRYERAAAEIDRLKADRQAAEGNAMWETTAHCTAVNHRSRSFCDHVADLDREIKDAAAVVDAGRPGTADGQSTTLSWATRLPQEVVAKGMPLMIAFAFEVTSMALFFAADLEAEESKAPPSEQPAATQAKPKKPRHRRSRKALPAPLGKPKLRVVR